MPSASPRRSPRSWRAIVPRAADDEQATLAPFADPQVAERISAQIDSGLQTPGAREVTLDHRPAPRLATLDGCTYLQPTVVLCDSPDHPLANREFLFPFAAVVAVSPEEMRADAGSRWARRWSSPR